MKDLKKIPQFKSEDSEINFWDYSDSTEFIDWEKAKVKSFPNLQKSKKAISIRLPEDMLFKLKQQANRIDIPYQTLIKLFIQDVLSRKAFV